MDTNLYSDDELILQMLEGKIKPYQLEEIMGRKEAAELRAKFIEKKFSKKTEAIRNHTINHETTKGNIENMIGAIQIPLGIAGPLEIKGKNFTGECLIPLATTEGALIASINRGCKTINLSGGATTQITRVGQTRAPLFEASSPEAAARLAAYTVKNFKKLKEIAQKESRHLKLKTIEPHILDNLVWLRIKAETGEAMGMNMISIAAQNIGMHVEKQIKGIKYLSVSGNLCVDKKPSMLTLKEGRGRYAKAEATLKEIAIRKVLKTTPKELEKLNFYKNIIGSRIAGSYGMNSHFANVIAAIYAATGQDLAHVVEGSHGTTEMEMEGKDLHVSVTIPAIQVGTIGGGTELAAQKESIAITGAKNADQLAEIIASAVLAGEISILAAHASKTLVNAHKRLNRK